MNSQSSTTSTGNGGVVVAVDGSQQGYAAVRYAAREAQRLSLRLDAIHVLPTNVLAGSAMMMMVPDETFQSYGAEILERARTAALDSVPDLRVTTRLLMGGGRIQELVAAARHARLMVLARPSSSGLDRIWTGGTITGVASRATCPVVVVPADAEPAIPRRRIVAGFKSPERAAELLNASFPLAEELDSELVVLHAWRLEGVYDDIIVDRVEEERWRREQTELIEREVVDYRTAFPQVPVRIFVRHEDPARALARATRGADRLLIVRPAHGGLVHHLGRTARAILREAHCPVEVLAPERSYPQPNRPTAVKRSGELVA
jgi:nucleotide-binding universal stress UspA family protein